MHKPIGNGVIALIALGLLVQPVVAEEGGYYGRLSIGASSPSDPDVDGAISGSASMSTGQVFGGAVGYAYAGSPFRAEIEYLYRTADADPFAGTAGGDLASTSLALNGYYDFLMAGPVIPYVGAGVGYVTEIDFDITSSTGSGTGAGEYSDRGGSLFQVMLGARYPVTGRLSLMGELRYFNAGSVTLDRSGGQESIELDYSGLEFNVGLQFAF